MKLRLEVAGLQSNRLAENFLGLCLVAIVIMGTAQETQDARGGGFHFQIAAKIISRLARRAIVEMMIAEA